MKKRTSFLNPSSSSLRKEAFFIISALKMPRNMNKVLEKLELFYLI
jgi:hypothetical protein